MAESTPLDVRAFDVDHPSPDSARRVVARGDLDAHTAPHLARMFDQVIAEGATLVLFDATDVHFVDSSGLRVVIEAGNRLSDAGGRLLIEGTSAAVQRVLEITGLLERFRD